MELDRARELGATAHKMGKQRAPILNREVYDAVHGMAVGDGAAAIFTAYTDGWDAEQRKAASASIAARIHAAAAR